MLTKKKKKKKKKLFANYVFPLYGLTWSMEHQSGTHAHFKKELESTQKFACKVITRNWDKGYDELLDTTNLQIESCTSCKLRTLYKIVHN